MSAPVTLLIVDDNPLYRHLAFMGVRSVDDTMPVLPVFAANTDEAVERFVKEKPQVTFLDINLPGSGNGLDLLDTFLDINPQAYVVMMTCRSDFESVQRAKDAGAHGYILKPFSAQKLLQALEGYKVFCSGGKALRRKQGYTPPLPDHMPEQSKLEMMTDNLVSLKTVMSSWHVMYVGREETGVMQALREADCRMGRFETGSEAWDYLENNHADVLIVDAFLPDMDGFHLADQVRLRDVKKTIKTFTIILFENDEQVNTGRMKLSGISSYLVKPTVMEQVQSHLYGYAARYRELINERFEK